ncbi:hypothetical protein JOC58_001079 [Paenibacillus hunanensis]|uniref:TetR family transcriptional regulator n=1 Tax=Paenibacillus hunanensis TaxID=539262 RepID=A0ABU1IV96_9BACL|nr:hypothetical protein [Paenibacillus hunanensis]
MNPLPNVLKSYIRILVLHSISIETQQPPDEPLHLFDYFTAAGLASLIQ